MKNVSFFSGFSAEEKAVSELANPRKVKIKLHYLLCAQKYSGNRVLSLIKMIVHVDLYHVQRQNETNTKSKK